MFPFEKDRLRSFTEEHMASISLKALFGAHQLEVSSENIVDSEQDFLESIANLPCDEQQKQMWYYRLAQRQGITEIEQRSISQ